MFSQRDNLDKNLKDTENNSIKDTISVSTFYKTKKLPLASYTKINKLITALYMVTDTMDNGEPIRLKLRTLGVEILSDNISLVSETFNTLADKINTILSFLNIASDLSMISQMNHSILKKEFIELKESIQEDITKNHLWLEEFMITSNTEKDFSIGHYKPTSRQSEMSLNKGHSTRIGVQKGSTLLKALGNIKERHIPQLIGGNNFEVLKNKRREEIINIIKDKKSTSSVDGVTITDIKNSAKGILVSCGEKTLQRELVSMVSDNILYRTGSKRWSQYFLKN